MKKIHAYPLMAMAMLTTASGAALAQHVVGGMGEEVRIGTFAGPTHGTDSNRGIPTARRFNTAKPGRQAADPRSARPISTRGAAPTLPGKHLP
ncbi:hypothetical protein [Cupriavidus sp. UYPR2.512]|uniref:hypothetical protein n=1 Tax=Cupriavidus sp. UYPR2.512 TaxID=1080187 RepID=UPI00035FC17C|nr:hypothetical protein [Cupriavidus sp. UYPR2.512]UIF84881.1 hypothetical protein KAF44_11675 [Cupriavidus necator]